MTEELHSLEELGWDPAWAETFAPLAERGLEPARVAVEFNHIFRVYGDRRVLRAEQAGRVRFRAGARRDLAAVGDWVALRTEASGRSATIEAILPRRTRFSRKAAGQTTEEQVVAANIDVVFLMMALDRDYNPRRLERYLLLANESGADPVVLLNKADLHTQASAAAAETAGLSGGAPVHPISARDGSGLTVLDGYMRPGRTAALLGSSGVGKSTLVNALLGRELLRTQDVRASDSRGRHTTRHRQLVVLPGRGLLIDTPGMRELQLWDVTSAVEETFDDIEGLAAGCHFSNCRHRDEPRCAVKAAVDRGELAPERLASYVKLQTELETLQAQQDVRSQIEERRRGRTASRALRQLYRQRQR